MPISKPAATLLPADPETTATMTLTHLPEFGSNLVTALASLQVNDFSHGGSDTIWLFQCPMRRMSTTPNAGFGSSARGGRRIHTAHPPSGSACFRLHDTHERVIHGAILPESLRGLRSYRFYYEKCYDSSSVELCFPPNLSIRARINEGMC